MTIDIQGENTAFQVSCHLNHKNTDVECFFQQYHICYHINTLKLFSLAQLASSVQVLAKA